MPDPVVFERIVASREMMHSKPRIAGTRVTMVQVLDLLAAGKSPSNILSTDYSPELTEADIRACLAYASHMLSAERVVSGI